MEPIENKILDDYTAIGIAEGYIKCDSQDEITAAWQHLEDSGLGKSLQGFFGRRLEELITSGIIKRKTT